MFNPPTIETELPANVVAEGTARITEGSMDVDISIEQAGIEARNSAIVSLINL